MTKFHVFIPARFGSSRLPGKVLIEIAKKPMIQHVYERALISGATSIVVAADDERVRAVAKKFGANVCMTSPTHNSGTDRIAEAVDKLKYADDAIIVDVQSDEPLIPPIIIKQVAENLEQNEKADVATLCEPIHDVEQLFNPNAVKVVRDKDEYALYFSRAPIPWDRDHFSLPLPTTDLKLPNVKSYFHHIGIYAYRASFLKDFVQRPSCDLEMIERLEQLRMMWYGAKIHVALAKENTGPSVDTESDLLSVKRILEQWH